MHSDETCLLAAILAAPDDDLPRLVYADWLEENAGTVECWRCKGTASIVTRYDNDEGPIVPGTRRKCDRCSGSGRVSDGRRERAEFIRVQCELADLEKVLSKPLEEQDLCSEVSANWCPTCGDCTCPDPEDRKDDYTCPLHNPMSRHGGDDSLKAHIHALRNRERELLSGWHPYWCSAAFGWTLGPFTETMGRSQPVARWERGFASEVRLPLAKFIGGECERCFGQGTIERRVFHFEPEGRVVGWDDCDTCHGTGRTPGVAAAIQRVHPVATWRIVDKEPYQYSDGEFGWFEADYTDNGYAVAVRILPSWLYGMMPSQRYPSRQAALDALSQACLRYAKAEAEKLEPELETA